MVARKRAGHGPESSAVVRIECAESARNRRNARFSDQKSAVFCLCLRDAMKEETMNGRRVLPPSPDRSSFCSVH